MGIVSEKKKLLEKNSEKEAALNVEKEKNLNLQKIIDELRLKISENNNIPSLQDITNSMVNLVKKEVERRLAKFKDEINTPKKIEQVDQIANKERSSETEQRIPDRNEEDDSQNQELEQILDEDKQDIENHIGFNCEFCDFKANKKTKLSKHVNSKHPDKEKPFTCNYCDEQLKSVKDIQEHLRRKHDRGKYPCDECGETLINTLP